MQEQLSNTIRLPNTQVYLRSEENHWKVLRSCDLLTSNREQLTQACTLEIFVNFKAGLNPALKNTLRTAYSERQTSKKEHKLQWV